MAEAKHRFDALDGLRGIAALMVLLGHTSAVAMPWFAPHNYLAVDFFFMLSGFVIGGAYEDRLASGEMSFGRFMAIRLIRLYPLILLGALIGALGVWKVYTGPTRLIVLLGALLIIPLPLAPASEGRVGFPGDPPQWSLFFELIGNAVYGLIARRLSTPALVALVAGFAVWLGWTAQHFGDLCVGGYWPNTWGGFPRFGFDFSAGLLLHRLWRGGLGERLRCNIWLPAAAFVILLQVPTRPELTGLYEFGVVTIAFPLILLAGAASREDGKVLRLAGALSYPCYILQGGIAPHIRALPTHLGLHGMLAVLVVLGCVAVYLALSYGALRLYDEPARRALASVLGRGRSLPRPTPLAPTPTAR